MLKKILFFIAFIGIYLLGIIFGVFSGMEYNFHTTENKTSSMEILFSETTNERFKDIAINNVIVGIKAFVLGSFSLGILAYIYLFYNGFIFGIVVGKVCGILTLNEILRVTLPHCTEIIGIALMGYLGFILSLRIVLQRNLLNKRNFLLLFIIAIIIIVLSAFLESYVSMSV